MLPVSDFNFVVCGMATFAATVGYVCSKRIRGNSFAPVDDAQSPPITFEPSTSTPSIEPVKIIPDPGASTRTSQKRKSLHDEDDYASLGYPYNLATIYPNKRSRTPPKEEEEKPSVVASQVVAVTEPSQDVELVETSPPEKLFQPEPQNTVEPTVAQREPEPAETMVDPPAQATEIEKAKEPHNVPKEAQSEKKESASEKKETSTLPTPPTTPETSVLFSQRAKPTFKPFTSSPGAFASFASSGSAFKTFTASTARPAWSDGNGQGISLSNANEDSSALAPALALETKPDSPTAHQPNFTHVTGEENETILSELKNVKVFIKRGAKEFSDGMLGHIKLLSDKNQEKERLIFRREPLWQVTMNTRLSPSVRCTFEEEECVLRVILAESTEGEGKGKREIVVYALKPGRGCTKQDFVSFAKTVMGREGTSKELAGKAKEP
ncbi:hypothetical protein V5O48_002507 [Marasmius crinis-equi]|uniref:RanBD1 domain-containing protein n=1 Tax=Marasmius crinis-equi TaxID=585013 RepID=A0ABR3FVW4_9AGAR